MFTSWTRVQLTEKQSEQFETEIVGSSSYSCRDVFKVTCKRCDSDIHLHTNNPSYHIEYHICKEE